MTVITLEEGLVGKEEPKLRKKKTPKVEEEKPVSEQEKPKRSSEQTCPHHFGYLGERSKKEKIPEGCMLCEKIVQCMLKNVTK